MEVDKVKSPTIALVRSKSKSEMNMKEHPELGFIVLAYRVGFLIFMFALSSLLVWYDMVLSKVQILGQGRSISKQDSYSDIGDACLLNSRMIASKMFEEINKGESYHRKLKSNFNLSTSAPQSHEKTNEAVPASNLSKIQTVPTEDTTADMQEEKSLDGMTPPSAGNIRSQNGHSVAEMDVKMLLNESLSKIKTVLPDGFYSSEEENEKLGTDNEYDYDTDEVSQTTTWDQKNFH